MSDLAGKLAALEQALPGTTCKTCGFLASLDDEDRAAFKKHLDAPKGDRVGADTLARAVVDLPRAPSRQSIEKHRRDRHE